MEKLKVLVVDDDRVIVDSIAIFIRADGYEIEKAYNGLEALDIVMTHTIHLIILDIMMPELDGIKTLLKLRESRNIPVILLSAKSEDADKILGLTAGADDYVTKPFSPIVLAARVRALLKREGRAAMPVEQLGSLSVNELRREVLVDGAPVDLTPKEYELLIYFKNNRAIALSRESILNAVWGYDYFGDLRTVDTHVKKLRAKLGGCGTMIETVRGYGYRFEG